MSRVNINVSATEYEKTSKQITTVLNLVEEMVHETDGFVVTESEFAFGWHFFVVSVRSDLVQKISEQMGEDFKRLKGKTPEKKFLSWLQQRIDQQGLKAKLAIKEEMESSKYGLF